MEVLEREWVCIWQILPGKLSIEGCFWHLCVSLAADRVFHFLMSPIDQLFYFKKKHPFAVIPGGYQTLDMLGIVGIERVDDNYDVAKCPWTD
jgi:hypothetical protein